MSTRRRLLLAGAALPWVGACASAAPTEWPAAPPERERLPPATLAAVLDDGARLPALRSLVVVREGELVGERYYGGASANQLLAVHSVTKNVVSMLVGQALQQGVLPGLSATVASLLPEAVAKAPGSAVAGVTLGDILTGRTGLAYDWQREARALAEAADPTALALAMRADPAAGAGRWSYNDAAIGLLSPILTRAHGRDMVEVAKRDLFAPLGITRFIWPGERGGPGRAYGGLMLRTRDLAKLAWTMLDGGRWQGEQRIPAAWAADSTRRHVAADWRVAPMQDIGYGYLWFTGRLEGQPVAWGWGYGGQFALLVPSLRLVVATAAVPPPIDRLAAQNEAIMALIARVVRSAG